MLRVLCFLFAFMLLASNVYSMTMDEAVSHALKNNPEIQSLRLEEEVVKGQLEKARLLLISNPTIEGDLSKKDKPKEEGGGRFTNYGVKLSQEFEIAGQRGLRIDIAEKGIIRVASEIKDRERTLASEIKDVFVRALALKKKVELRKEAVRLKESLLNFTKIKFHSGEVSGLEVNLAEVELSKAKVELLSTEREYRESILTLQMAMGAKPSPDFKVEGELAHDIPLIKDKESLKKLAFIQRPDLSASALEIERSQSALNLTNREAVPNVTLSGFYDRDEQRNTVGLALSIPLPLFDRKQAERREAKVRLEQARIRLSGLEKTVDKEIEEAYTNLKSAIEEISLFREEIMNRAMENLELMGLAFKEGKIGFFDVRLAQRDTIETQFAYIDSQLKTRLAINAIERVIGGYLK
ncbi:MAG: TolC family protein [Nitrospirota bacterium]